MAIAQAQKDNNLTKYDTEVLGIWYRKEAKEEIGWYFLHYKRFGRDLIHTTLFDGECNPENIQNLSTGDKITIIESKILHPEISYAYQPCVIAHISDAEGREVYCSIGYEPNYEPDTDTLESELNDETQPL